METSLFFWFKRVLHRGPEHRESKMTVLGLLIIIILIIIIIIIIIIIYTIIIKLLIMENHPSQNRKTNSQVFSYMFFKINIFSK
jgi:hypothetical protein